MNRKLKGFLFLFLFPIFLLLFLPVLATAKILKYVSCKVVNFWNTNMSETIIPFVVDLFYVHSVGKIHVFLLKMIAKSERPHSRSIRVDVITRDAKQPCSIHTIAQLSDNYGYLIIDKSIRNYKDLGDNKPDMEFISGALVDCADAEACVSAIESISRVHYGGIKIRIECILTTHHHWDHQAGNIDFPNLIKLQDNTSGKRCVFVDESFQVYGSEIDNVLGCTAWVKHESIIKVGCHLEFLCLMTPCHTRGSLIYKLAADQSRDCLFTGDTIFIGGWGAFFEGHEISMMQNFRFLQSYCHPDNLVFPGHEYSDRILQEYFPVRAANMADSDIRAYMALCFSWGRARHLRSLSYPAPTVPWPLGEEFLYNSMFRRNRQTSTTLHNSWLIGKERVLMVLSMYKQLTQNIGRGIGRGQTTDDALISNSQPKAPVRRRRSAIMSGIEGMGVTAADPTPPSGIVRPRIVFDPAGKAVVLDPPWILKAGEAGSPMAVVWKSPLAELVELVDGMASGQLSPDMRIIQEKLVRMTTGFPLEYDPLTNNEPSYYDCCGMETKVEGGVPMSFHWKRQNDKLYCVNGWAKGLPSADELEESIRPLATAGSNFKMVRREDLLFSFNDGTSKISKVQGRISEAKLLWAIACGEFGAVIGCIKQLLNPELKSFHTLKDANLSVLLNDKLESRGESGMRSLLNTQEIFKNLPDEVPVVKVAQNLSRWISGGIFDNKLFSKPNERLSFVTCEMWNFSSLEDLSALAFEVILLSDASVHDFTDCNVCRAGKVKRQIVMCNEKVVMSDDTNSIETAYLHNNSNVQDRYSVCYASNAATKLPTSIFFTSFASSKPPARSVSSCSLPRSSPSASSIFVSPEPQAEQLPPPTVLPLSRGNSTTWGRKKLTRDRVSKRLSVQHSLSNKFAMDGGNLITTSRESTGSQYVRGRSTPLKDFSIGRDGFGSENFAEDADAMPYRDLVMDYKQSGSLMHRDVLPTSNVADRESCGPMVTVVTDSYTQTAIEIMSCLSKLIIERLQLAPDVAPIDILEQLLSGDGVDPLTLASSERVTRRAPNTRRLISRARKSGIESEYTTVLPEVVRLLHQVHPPVSPCEETSLGVSSADNESDIMGDIRQCVMKTVKEEPESVADSGETSRIVPPSAERELIGDTILSQAELLVMSSRCISHLERTSSSSTDRLCYSNASTSSIELQTITSDDFQPTNNQ